MSAKVSISLPEDLLRRFDGKRRAKGLGRSAAFQRAVRLWTSPEQVGPGWDWEFIEAYRKEPQDPRDIEAWLVAGLETWSRKARKRSRGR